MLSPKEGSLISFEPKEIRLKRKVRAHLAHLGFTKDSRGGLLVPGVGKEVIRGLHAPQRIQIVQDCSEFVARRLPKLHQHFAAGTDINVARISPRLERIRSDTWQSDLFRLASLSWSVPVSSGFGRRLRFLVWDESNGKLIGILAIGDPVFNLSVRDNFIGWTGADRSDRLVNVLDAYVLGAVPPYNTLLGGKLVACLARSTEVFNEFSETYGKSVGVISQQSKHPHLLAITTSSSMGRSSLYNRLKIKETVYFKSIGFSGGWGHFHVPDDLFVELREFLRGLGHNYADLHAFGEGPNWRIRVIRAALGALGFRGDMLKHGIQREVFIALLADNSLELLRGGKGAPVLETLQSAAEIGRLAVERWLLPRAESRPEYRLWCPNSMEALIRTGVRSRPNLIRRDAV